eukprot:scaffold6124_cov122-Cylindrotheca_fusiformis.AAC.37
MRAFTKSIFFNVLLLASKCVISEAAMPISQQMRLQTLREHVSMKSVFEIRGGAKKKSRTGSLSKSARTVTGKKKVATKDAKTKQDAATAVLKGYKDIPLLTRIYISMVGIFTLIALVLGDELSQALFALDPLRTFYGFQIWRILTAGSFLGKPSMSWLMSGYYLYRDGKSLENAYGPAQYLVFLLSQATMLSMLSALVGQPFFATSMITSMLHVISRAMPNMKVKWIVFTVPNWFLPYGLMVTDMLQGQSLAPAVPHILGILSGHFYHYHRFIWPKTGGQDWLTAPDFLIERMDPDSAMKLVSKASLNKALKVRNRGKGKKLGGK